MQLLFPLSVLPVAACLLFPLGAQCLDLPKEMGKETAECVRCHREHTPGVVYDWARSRHAWTRPEAAFEKPTVTRRISTAKVPEAFKGRVVGCFECHGQNPDLHPETFDHMGYRIHLLVTPPDCAVCHPVEVGEFSQSRKASSYAELLRSPLAGQIADALVGRRTWSEGSLRKEPAGEEVLRESCWSCHGAPVSVVGKGETRTSQGDVEVTTLANWPNQGIGRINPDGSRGTCAACHGRHAFAIEDARHPEACIRCHSGGHSPAKEAYGISSHGALYRAREPEFDWGNVPWVVGQDFSVPTCAACHASQVVDGRGVVVVPRSHDFDSRLWVRLLTRPVIDRQVESPPGARSGTRKETGDALADTPTSGPIAIEALCTSCHGGSFADARRLALNAAVRDTAAGIQAATSLLWEGWQRGVAGREKLFDDPLECLWLEVWFLDATAARYGVAMGGFEGLGTLRSGRSSMNRALQVMERKLSVGRVSPRP